MNRPSRRRSGTDLTVVLDRSASMRPLVGTVVTEVDRLVAAVTADDPEATVTIVTFSGDDPCDLVVDRAGAADLPALSHGDYRPGGRTPLYDGVGLALRFVSERRRDDALLLGHRRPARIAVVTDGHENASTLFGALDVLGMVKRRRARGWRFSYLGVGDVARDARRIGFEDHEIHPWTASPEGTREAFGTISTLTRDDLEARDDLELPRAVARPRPKRRDDRPSSPSASH